MDLLKRIRTGRPALGLLAAWTAVAGSSLCHGIEVSVDVSRRGATPENISIYAGDIVKWNMAPDDRDHLHEFVVWEGPVLHVTLGNEIIGEQLVEFYEGEQLIGTVTDPPYRLYVPLSGGASNELRSAAGDEALFDHPYNLREGTSHVFRAVAVGEDGAVLGRSPAITVHVAKGHVFRPMVLPGGEVAFFFSKPGVPNCIHWSSALGEEAFWSAVRPNSFTCGKSAKGRRPCGDSRLPAELAQHEESVR